MSSYTGILGPLLLSIFVNTYASGLVGVQYALFQSLKYKKSLTIRLAVLLLYIVDVFQIIVAFYMIWIYCVTNYVDPTALDNVALWVFTTIPLCSAISGFIAHVFITYRISLFTERKPQIVAPLAVFSLAVFILGVGAGAYGIAKNVSMMDVVSGASTYRTLLLAWFAARVVLDLVLLGSLGYIYYLQRQTFLNHIQLPYLRLGLIAVQCGSITTFFSICTLITFAASPKTTIYLVFLLPSGRLYASVLLTTLNSIHPREVRTSPADIITKDIWAVRRTTRHSVSYTQSISLHQIRTEPELDAVGSQSGADTRSVSSHISTTQNRIRDEKKPERLVQFADQDENIE